MSGRYLLARLASSAFVVLGIVLLSFLITHIVPADPARIAAGIRATPEQVDVVRRQLGLDQPLWVQFGRFLAQIAHGDLGQSFVTLRPVTEDIGFFFPATFELVMAAMFIQAVIGLFAGIYVATTRSHVPPLILRITAIGFMGVPVFWLGLIAQIVLYGGLGWFPAGGRIDGAPPSTITGMYVIDSVLTGNLPALESSLWHLALPALCLGISRVGVVMRFVDTELSRVMQADYVRTARAKGLSERLVVWKHALRNALGPVVTMVGLQFGWTLGGTVLIETVFAWPGLGRYAVESIGAFDFMPVIVTSAVLGLCFVIINFLVDIIQRWLDPRIELT